MNNRLLVRILKIIPFLFLLLYFGERSLISTDEGFYALQSRWILENNNWIAPLWWGNIYLDRTIGIQYLLALSQKYFGIGFFSIYIPNIIAGSAMLFLTYKIHQEIINKKNAIISPLILATTFLWINYFHMATQDIIFSSLITVGIYSAIKSYKSKKNIFFITSGLWIGLAFMLKTYLVIIPLIGFLPFYIKNNTLKNKYFYFGFLLGFFPFLIWSFKLISIYNFKTLNGLFNKLIDLSKNNTFTNPFYYYLWNLPLNTFPWCIFSTLGIYKVLNSNNKLSKYFLLKFPLIIIILLSLFSTKTPYYCIQLLPLLSINSYIGLNYIFNEKNIFTRNLKISIFTIVPLILSLFLIYFNNQISLNDLYFNYKLLINIFIVLFISSWLIIPFSKSTSKNIFLTILGPYLLFSFVVQSGILSDRSKEMRIESKYIVEKEMINDKNINFIIKGIKDEKTTEKLIKITLFMPKIGNGLRTLESLESHQYAWTCLPENILKENKDLRIVYENKNFNPWKLIFKTKRK